MDEGNRLKKEQKTEFFQHVHAAFGVYDSPQVLAESAATPELG